MAGFENGNYSAASPFAAHLLKCVMRRIKYSNGVAPRATVLRPVLLCVLLLFLPVAGAATAQEAPPGRASASPPDAQRAKDSKLVTAGAQPLDWPQTQPPVPALPAQVTIPANQHIPVDLETPLTSGVSKRDEIVTFRTLYSMLLDDGLEIPPGTEIQGHVVGVKHVDHLGRGGMIRLAVDRMCLDPAHTANLQAHIDATELLERLRIRAVSPVSSNANPGQGPATGDAGVSVTGQEQTAGSGAPGGVLAMTSLHREDVYLEQGMRFTIILDRPVSFSGAAIYAAQQDFEKHSGPATLAPDSRNRATPELKRRLGRN